jgi:hypothetical protein
MLELIQTVLAALTFIVFSITAILALIQLHHLRVSYQMTTASAVLQEYWTPQFQEWMRFVRFDFESRFSDPHYRQEFEQVHIDRLRHPEIFVCEYYSLIGSYVRNELIPRHIFLENGSWDAVMAWTELESVVTLMRKRGGPMLYRDFENLGVLCRGWLEAHGTPLQ